MGGLVANEHVHKIEHRSFDFMIKMGLRCTPLLATSPPMSPLITYNVIFKYLMLDLFDI